MGISIFFILIISLIFPSIIATTKAKVAGKKGPVVLQVFYDNIRLLKKGSIYSKTTSFIFQIAPVVYFSTIMVSTFFIPFGHHEALLSFDGDFILFAYILALGKFFTIIAAMDTGSGFEGMGANREAYYSMLVEPAFFIIIASLALLTNNTSFHDLFNSLHIQSELSIFTSAIAVYVILWIAMVENSRLPVDDPKTHLELTMVHEVMVLDYSGFDLALIQLANGIKFTIYGALIFNFIMPNNLSWITLIISFILIQIGFAISTGLLESFKARHKMMKNPQWIVSLSVIAIIAFFSVIIITSKIILI